MLSVCWIHVQKVAFGLCFGFLFLSTPFIKEQKPMLHPKSILQSDLLLQHDFAGHRARPSNPIFQFYWLPRTQMTMVLIVKSLPSFRGQTDSRYFSRTMFFSKIFRTVPEVFLLMVCVQPNGGFSHGCIFFFWTVLDHHVHETHRFGLEGCCFYFDPFTIFEMSI